MSKGEFLADRRNPPCLVSYLGRTLEAMFDVGGHILAKTYGFEEIEYKAIAKQLGERGIVTRELSDILGRMSGEKGLTTPAHSDFPEPLDRGSLFLEKVPPKGLPGRLRHLQKLDGAKDSSRRVVRDPPHSRQGSAYLQPSFCS